jgi:hypothetical protein
MHICRAALLKAEEDSVQKMCAQIAAFKPDLVITEKVCECGWVKVCVDAWKVKLYHAVSVFI